jgi:CheY-like chemotaxis protein
MQATARKPASKKPLCIFIVDDNPDAILTLALLLRDEGYIVHTCANPHIAMDALRGYKPDVCILDIKMPGKSGYDLAREISGAGLVPEPVLIATSGHYKKPAEQLLARAVGFRHFVPKDADPKQLLEIIDALAPDDDPPLAA